MPIPTLTITPFSGPAARGINATMQDVYLALGGTPDPFATGGYAISFVPDDLWNGAFTVMGTGTIKQETDDAVSPAPYPYRAFYLNGFPSDLSMQSPAPTITGRSEIIVPSSGQQIFLYIGQSAPGVAMQGTCAIYLRAVIGSTAP